MLYFDQYLTVLYAQVNDAVLVGDHTLVSCSSDTTLKVGHALQCCHFS